MTAWQTQVARLLAWLLVLPGVGCFWFAAVLWRESGDAALFAVMPLVIGAAVGGGLYLTAGSVTLALQLQHAVPGARLKAVLIGLTAGLLGLLTLPAVPAVGAVAVAYGGLLTYCVSCSQAQRDLGPWRSGLLR
jgi:hypothetical protein